MVTEAMSEGIPVIASPNGFARDLICDWKNGFLVEHGNEKKLTNRMEHFLRQPFLSNALGLNARQAAESVILDWNFFNRHLQAYGIRSVAMEVKTPMRSFSASATIIFIFIRWERFTSSGAATSIFYENRPIRKYAVKLKCWQKVAVPNYI